MGHYTLLIAQKCEYFVISYQLEISDHIATYQFLNKVETLFQ